MKYIEVTIIDDEEYEKDEYFSVVLSNAVDCELGNVIEAKVKIKNDDDVTDLSDRLAKVLSLNLDKYRVGSHSWKQQFKDAVEAPPNSGAVVWCLHILNLPWKVAFAFCPPPRILGGSLCFFTALGFIAIVTILIQDLAQMLGCAFGIKDSITAVTIVALGTSLPDTFASKAAATGDSTADSSIGNVTGSNSVNVFLGIGMPWTLGAFYWWAKGEKFIVESGDLSSAVIIFTICALVCVFTLVLRRAKFGYELGGKMKYPTGVLFIGLWLVYVVAYIIIVS